MKYCLIGEKLSHSFSADIHNARGFDYTLKEIPQDALKSFFDSCEYDGFNITIPYKNTAMQLVDEISFEAKEIGAINTVKREGGRLIGYNTDLGGIKYMLKRKGVSLKDKNVLILGTGGASKPIHYLAKCEGAKSIDFVSRSGAINYDNYMIKAKNAEIIFNATPVGMYPDNDSCKIDLLMFKNLLAVFDLVYNPLKTKLIEKAEKLGIACSNGLSMLVEQALLSEDIWTNGQHEGQDTEELIAKITKQKTNIILCGMPSSGKTTIGKEIATLTAREFIDTDAEILKRNGKSPKDIIETLGENEFRNRETAVIKDISKIGGRVIALGGGAILREENVIHLRQNGVIVQIDRDLSKLSIKGRPISKKCGIEELYKTRKPIYDSVSDIIVKNNGTKIETAQEVIREYENTCNKWC